MDVKMAQHAVGQGGLFSGTLSAGAKPLRWVYDCGSNQADALTREIATVAAGGDLDLLFISHLDSDHVSGIDKLLASVKVQEVVLPYLDKTALLVALARDAAQGTLSGVFVEAVNDLVGWFGSRGVETITFVNGRDDDESDGPVVPDPPEGGGEGDCAAKWTRDGRSSLERPARDQVKDVARTQELEPDAALLVSTPTRQLNWALIPYVHQPSAKLMKAFDDALEAEFGNTDKKAIAESAKDPEVRKKLRNCYDALWSDHNLVSMTLYAGPIKPGPISIELRAKPIYHNWNWRREADDVGGWMLTGDTHLKGVRRRQRFLKFYAKYTPMINVLMLPHHGSIHNHSAEVLDAMPELWIGFAAAGPNSYGHPHEDVRDAVKAHRRASFHKVGEKRSSQIVMEIRMP